MFLHIPKLGKEHPSMRTTESLYSSFSAGNLSAKIFVIRDSFLQSYIYHTTTDITYIKVKERTL